MARTRVSVYEDNVQLSEMLGNAGLDYQAIISYSLFYFPSKIFNNRSFKYNFSLPTFTDFKKLFSSNAIK